MKKRISVITFWLTLGALALSTGAPALVKFGFSQSQSPTAAAQKQTSSTAQTAAKRQWFYILESNLKPGVANEYYEFRAEERVPALKKAGYKHQEFWVSAIGPRGKMFTVEPMDNLSIFGQDQNHLTRGLGEEGARALGAKTSQYLAGGAHTWLAQSRPELSWTSQMTTPLIGVCALRSAQTMNACSSIETARLSNSATMAGCATSSKGGKGNESARISGVLRTEPATFSATGSDFVCDVQA